MYLYIWDVSQIALHTNLEQKKTITLSHPKASKKTHTAMGGRYSLTTCTVFINYNTPLPSVPLKRDRDSDGKSGREETN